MHPGTVRSKLSAPFSSGISNDKIFTVDYSVSTKMINVIENLTTEDSSKLLVWNRKEIDF